MLRYTEEQNKPASVWQGWMSHSPGGRQVHPEQTKAVKGQDGKTLATAGAIKRLLPCPVKGMEKQSILYGVKRKKQSKKKRKKIRKKTEKKKKETKKKKKRVSSMGMHQ